MEEESELEFAQFQSLWQRHILALRDDLSTASIEAAPSRSTEGSSNDERDGSPDGEWDDKIDSIVDALDELELSVAQHSKDSTHTSPGMLTYGDGESPNTTIGTSHSPRTPRYPAEKESYAETVLSSPETSSWTRTVRPSRPGHLQLTNNNEDDDDLIPPVPKRKHKHHVPDSPRIEFLLEKTLSLNPLNTILSYPITTILRTPTSPSWQRRRPPSQVNVLILTWATDGPSSSNPSTPTSSGSLLPVLTYPGRAIEREDIDALRGCLKRRGYHVQCRGIPGDYCTAAVGTLLSRFLEEEEEPSGNGETLSIVYYRGYGGLDEEGRMAFWSGFGTGNPPACFFWDDIRPPLLQTSADVLLVFDCTSPPNTTDEQREISRLETGATVPFGSAKQLLGLCAQYDVLTALDPDTPTKRQTAKCPGGMMTRALCRVLDRTGDVSVQRLCSLMREDLRGRGGLDEIVAAGVFVSQLGGGQLLDIQLPVL